MFPSQPILVPSTSSTTFLFKCFKSNFIFSQCVSVIDTITFCSLLYNGFHFYRTSLTYFFELFPFRPFTLISGYESPVKHLAYWHRPHISKTRLPIIFIHGIGIGLYPYINFLHELSSREYERCNGDVGIIAPEIMPISSRITHSASKRTSWLVKFRASSSRVG